MPVRLQNVKVELMHSNFKLNGRADGNVRRHVGAAGTDSATI